MATNTIKISNNFIKLYLNKLQVISEIKLTMSPERTNTRSLAFCQIILALSLISLIHCQTDTDNTTYIPAPGWLNSSQTELSLYLTDQYNYFVTPAGNKVWAGAMSLAWNDLKKQFLNGQNMTLNLKEEDVVAKKVLDNLNAQIFTKEEISQQSYYVKSGFGQSTIDKINFEINTKFPQRTIQPLKDTINDQDFISYAYLYKKFLYPTPFKHVNSVKFKNSSVPGFQTSSSKQRSQVYVKYYNDATDFMIGIKTANQKDEILLLKSPHTQMNSMKISKVLGIVDMYETQPNLKFNNNDKFQMPVIEFDYTRNFYEMLMKKLTNSGFENYEIMKMEERVKMKMNRFGVTLENTGTVIIRLTSTYISGRKCYLDNDFWVVLKEKNKKPYFIMQVKNVKQTWTNPAAVVV